MTDPYKVLGVNRNATEEEIKKAYHDLARKYHPDNYVNTPLSDLAQEKMKEINEAYDTITRSQGKSSNAYDSQYTYGSERQDDSGDSDGGGSYSESTQGGSASFYDIRGLINERNYYEADVRLNAVPNSDRNAEWFFLKGCVFSGRGWYYEASKYYETACRMDPDNPEYREALGRIKNGNGANARRATNVCDVCSTLICCDCCCEAMGGDLISCC